MRRTMIVILAASTVALAACGSGSGVPASRPRPPAPVNLAVYVNDAKVSVSPASVGAGPVVFVVTNQASHAEALAISAAGQMHPLASTAPINPQATTQVTVNFRPGVYTIATAPRGTTEASAVRPPLIASASIHIGPPRADSNNVLLLP
jgi:hypothetical protein